LTRHTRVAWSALALTAVLCAVALALGASSEPAAVADVRAPRVEEAPEPLRRPDTIVVRARSVGDLPLVADLTAALGYSVLQQVEEPPALLVKLPPGVTLPQGVTGYTTKDGVLYAEPAYPFASTDLPPDPLFASHQQPYLARMGAPQAWDIVTGSPGVIVAVLDTGLDVSHPDLRERVWRNPVDVPNGADDDGDGCVDDVHGCAFLYTPSEGCAEASGGDIADDLGHGTFVAGIIGASGNGSGMVGVARGVTILPVKILDCKGSGNTFSLAQGILYAVQRGARVLNVSLGGPVDSAYVREAIRIARVDYGALLVAATGNSGGDVSYPAKYAEVLAVAATDAGGNARAPYSNSGPEVDVAAIGEGIIGTVRAEGCPSFITCLEGSPGYGSAGGTSFAAPLVSGLAALVLSRNPFLSPDAVAGVIRSTADPLPAGDRVGWAGGGRINMQRALLLPFRLGAPGSTRN